MPTEPTGAQIECLGARGFIAYRPPPLWLSAPATLPYGKIVPGRRAPAEADDEVMVLLCSRVRVCAPRLPTVLPRWPPQPLTLAAISTLGPCPALPVQPVEEPGHRRRSRKVTFSAII